MNIRSFFKGVLFGVLAFGLMNCALAAEPVNPNASPEARALLDLFYRISGKYMLTGQHNYPNTKDQNSRFAAKYSGQTPAIWSTDMGFAKEGDKDSYLARPEIIKEAIRQHKKGSIITICWHAVPPTANEPVTFQTQGKGVPDSLASVQGRFSDAQFKEILTPGTGLYNKWTAQVDSIAVYLKELKDAHVPVLWRPYHEMNGDWFWWGGRVGENSTIDLYRQIFDRLVNHHKLNNLIWVWNVDRPGTPVRKFSNFYPGDQFFDIASLDVYGSDFKQTYYDSLLVLAKGKPILFGEVGNPPMPDVLKKQPNWASWVIWAGMVKNISQKQYQDLVKDPRMLNLEDPAYWEVTAPYRKACGLPLLPLKAKYAAIFSGKWVFNEEKSNLGQSGSENVPGEMEIDQDEEIFYVKKHMIAEYGNDQITNEEILLDGTEMKSEFYNSPRISTASINNISKSLTINSVVKVNRGGQITEMKSSEEWSLQQGGIVLVIIQTSTGFRGEITTLRLLYNKK
jgi:mannan endo-1,4-beta-mannosidase